MADGPLHRIPPLDYEAPNARRRVTPLEVFLIAALLALAIALLLPEARPRRRLSSRTPCGSSMRQMGQALMFYAKNHQGRLPQNLQSLVAANDLDPRNLFCPENVSKGTVPYIYLGSSQRTLSSFGSEDIVVYEPISNHNNAGANAVFGDGHVTFLLPNQLEILLEQTQRHLATQPVSTQPSGSAAAPLPLDG